MSTQFKFLSFDRQTFKVYFRYDGSTSLDALVLLSWRGLTTHYTPIKFEKNDSIIYFISLTDEKIWDFVDTMKLEIIYNGISEEFDIFIQNEKKDYQFLYKFNTLKKDTPFYSFKEIFLDKVYENDLVKVEKNDVVVDIGTNYGFFIQSILNKNPSEIHCYEPTPEIFEKLVENFRNEENIIFNRKAITNRTGNIMFTNDVASASNRISETEHGYSVESLDINELVEMIGKKINFMKIDCEGCENQIFSHISSENLKKIDKIVIEFHSEEIKKNISERLKRENFHLSENSNNILFAHRKEEKKKIVLISTFCDTEKKVGVLKDNLKKIKDLGLDTMIIAPNFLTLEQEIIKISDFVFYTKENPLLEYPLRHYTHWYEMQLHDERVITLHRGFADYGWAALYQTKKLSQIALTFDYDIFYHLIYDVEIDDTLKRELLSDEVNLIHPRRNPNHPEEIWETTLHFMVFDRDMMKKIEKEITLDEYISTNGVAEGEVLKWTKKHELKISNHCVKDKIFYWENFDFFNISPFEEFKFFVSKNPDLQIWLGYKNPYAAKLNSNLRVVFYDIPQDFRITIFLDEQKYDLNPKNWEFIELPHDSQNLKNFKLVYKNKEIDFSEIYSKIMLNQIYYNFREKI